MRKSIKGSTHLGHEFVDLGLPSGRLWAKCNLGAKNVCDCGKYYSYGSLRGFYKNKCKTNPKKKSPYNLDFSIIPTGSTYFNLPKQFDAVAHEWGGLWHMPTSSDFTELRENCTFTYGSMFNNYGLFAKSVKNDKSIFIPFGGYVDEDKRVLGRENEFNLWSSSIDLTNCSDDDVWSPTYFYGDEDEETDVTDYYYYGGFNLRGVI